MEHPAPTVLAVDDNPLNLKLLRGALEAHDYRVVTVASGAEALAMIADVAPDVVLLDVVMPDMDGYAVCQRIRAEPSMRFLPVVMITAYEEQERLRALEAGADDFIYRPLNQAELLARVRSLVRLKRYQGQIERHADELAALNASLEQRVREQIENIERLSRLRRFLSPQVADLVIASSEPLLLESHRREIVVVYCGLHGFGRFADQAEPEVVMDILRELHATLGRNVHRYEGTVGHIAEAGLLVFFNDPLPCDQPARQASQMALSMREQLRPVIDRWRRLGFGLDFFAGIDMGFATLGRIGFEGREDYAAVGRVVRAATRLAEGAEAGQILASGRIAAEIGADFDVSQQVVLNVPGLPTQVLAYRLERARTAAQPELSRREREVASLVSRGLTNRQIAEALVVSERTVETHLERIFAKLDLHARAQLATWASAHGLAPEHADHH
jgi:DNA-binding NarL/FixJ family response regulator